VEEFSSEVVPRDKLVKAQEGEFLTSIVGQTQKKPEQEKVQSEGLFRGRESAT
jgi:hypothetical protein